MGWREDTWEIKAALGWWSEKCWGQKYADDEKAAYKAVQDFQDQLQEKCKNNIRLSWFMDWYYSWWHEYL